MEDICETTFIDVLKNGRGHYILLMEPHGQDSIFTDEHHQKSVRHPSLVELDAKEDVSLHFDKRSTDYRVGKPNNQTYPL